MTKIVSVGATLAAPTASLIGLLLDAICYYASGRTASSDASPVIELEATRTS
jgi:hypothetical protein